MPLQEAIFEDTKHLVRSALDGESHFSNSLQHWLVEAGALEWFGGKHQQPLTFVMHKMWTPPMHHAWKVHLLQANHSQAAVIWLSTRQLNAA
jgi:hypothetical protein